MKIYESKENEDCRIIVDKGKDILLVLNEPLVLAGDVKFEITAKALKKGKFATFWINTTFTPEDGIFALTKSEIDKACKDTSNKEVPEKFWIELRYHTHIDKQTLPNVNTVKPIRPASTTLLTNPQIVSDEVTINNKNNRRSSTSDVGRTSFDTQLSKNGLNLISPLAISELDESVKRSGSLPIIASQPQHQLEPDMDTEEETEDEDECEEDEEIAQ